MIYAFFLFVFVQKSFLTRKCFLYVEINLTTRGSLYIDCIIFIGFHEKVYSRVHCILCLFIWNSVIRPSSGLHLVVRYWIILSLISNPIWFPSDISYQTIILFKSVERNQCYFTLQCFIHKNQQIISQALCSQLFAENKHRLLLICSSFLKYFGRCFEKWTLSNYFGDANLTLPGHIVQNLILWNDIIGNDF